MLTRTNATNPSVEPLKNTMVTFKGTGSAQTIPLVTIAKDCRIAFSVTPIGAQLPSSGVQLRLTYPGEIAIQFLNFYSDINATASNTSFVNWTDNIVRFSGASGVVQPDLSFIDTMVVPAGTILEAVISSGVTSAMFGCLTVIEFSLNSLTVRY